MYKSISKLVFIILAAYLLPTQLLAQKFGYVNTNFILSKMPEYNEAKGEIDKLAVEWQMEIQNMQVEIDNMHSDFKAEEVLLTVEMKEDRLKIIAENEVALKEYQKKVFGFEGLFFLKKKELIKPVQDRVFEAVEKMAHEHKLQIVFDKSGELVMIYTDPVHDYTDFVLEELGLGDPNDVLDN